MNISGIIPKQGEMSQNGMGMMFMWVLSRVHVCVSSSRFSYSLIFTTLDEPCFSLSSQLSGYNCHHSN